MRIYTKTLLLVFLSICLAAFNTSQKTTVKLTKHNNKSVLFKIKSQKLEWVNGRINLAILSTDNKLLQLNNISEQWLTDTTFRNRNITMLLIDSNMTFTQNARLLPLIEITCAEVKKGKPISIRAHGRVYLNKSWYTVTVNFTGTLPEKRFTGQLKKSTH